MTSLERHNANTSILTQQNNNSVRGGDDWVDTMMSCAQAVNKMFVRNTCRVCQVYTDRQVEFEVSRENNPVERAFLKVAASMQPEVELYRQFMFDEESVVSGLRDEEEEDDCEEEEDEVQAAGRSAAALENEARSIQTQLTH